MSYSTRVVNHFIIRIAPKHYERFLVIGQFKRNRIRLKTKGNLVESFQKLLQNPSKARILAGKIFCSGED